MRRLLALAVLAAGCGESTPPDIGTTRTEIDALIKAFHENMNRGDLDALVAMLDSEFSLVWGGEEPVYGREKSSAKLKEFIEQIKGKDLAGKRKPMFSDVRIRQEGQIALATYNVAFLEGDKPFVEAYTQVFRRSSGKWLLYHDHRSAKK